MFYFYIFLVCVASNIFHHILCRLYRGYKYEKILSKHAKDMEEYLVIRQKACDEKNRQLDEREKAIIKKMKDYEGSIT